MLSVPRKSNSMEFSSIKVQKNYDVGRMRRHTQNILQWNKNDIKSTRMTNGDYWYKCWQIVVDCYVLRFQIIIMQRIKNLTKPTF